MQQPFVSHLNLRRLCAIWVLKGEAGILLMLLSSFKHSGADLDSGRHHQEEKEGIKVFRNDKICV